MTPDIRTKSATDGPLADTLLGMGRFLRRGEVSQDLRPLFLEGGRTGDVFYRDRWSHDKVVRSTHGVNCTGSCSWKVYVKDGIITWETQQTDYPSVGPDSPEYEPRGCPRGAAFSWYTYSPTRVRYPYIRGALPSSTARPSGHPDPVVAWASIVDDPEASRAYKSARGKGGLVRTTWDEAVEIVAAAHVHTIKNYGPDRVAGLLADPRDVDGLARGGRRFLNLLGGTMLSFYDWYADLPVASPQVFGDQTDVPESADWWNASYLIMWGSNVPVTRTPDAHFMAEARYRGQKVVTVSPDYTDNTKFADEWLAPHPGTDGALAMAMGHVILREFFVERRTPRFADYAQALHRCALPGHPRAATATRCVPGKFLTAADLGGFGCRGVPNAEFKTVLLDADGPPVVPNGSLGHRFGPEDEGPWNLDLGDSTRRCPSPTRHADGAPSPSPASIRPAPEPGGEHERGAGVSPRRAGAHGRRDAVTTVFDLLLAQYGVGRTGPARHLAHGLRRRRRRPEPPRGRRRSPRCRPRRPSGSAASSPTTPSGPAAAR